MKKFKLRKNCVILRPQRMVFEKYAAPEKVYLYNVNLLYKVFTECKYAAKLKLFAQYKAFELKKIIYSKNLL